jgi:acetyl-CoA acetyltransferase
MNHICYVIGAGMLPFVKPTESLSLPVMGEQAARAAINDADITYAEVEQAFVGHVYGDSTSGQAALYGVGMTGIPVVNTNNNCASGSTALYLGTQAIRAGSECVMVLGMEQMLPGALASVFPSHENPLRRHGQALLQLIAYDPKLPATVQFYSAAAREYCNRYGVSSNVFAEIVSTIRGHAVNNPMAVFRQAVSAEQILSSPMISDPITRLQCCPPTCGAAALILASEEFVKSRKLKRKSIAISGIALATDQSTTFDSGSAIALMGANETSRAVAQASAQAGFGSDDCQVIELHDSFSVNAILSLEALGLSREGQAESLIRDGDHTYGGRWVINPSGGLISKGHPLGATGVAQVVELVQQLRGEALARQVDGARRALAHNQGIGGATVVTLLSQV